MTERQYSSVDRVLLNLHSGLSTLLGSGHSTARTNPSENKEAPLLNSSERRHAAGLMRVNHAGEVAAQALYLGQAATARSSEVRTQLLHAAEEEKDHLAWCEQRLSELEEKPSRLSPLWYAGAYAIGALNGLAGDRWSLGFVAETEKQVVEHLQGHLGKLPERDVKSRSIVREMQSDEAAHGAQAVAAGGRELPRPIQRAMRAAAKMMTRTAYWI
ncbi:MAG: 2-polyprenyl-3-methyl-6-methoxy-1,4-benzoquinone monooxygenase [Nevskiales bacterium]